MTATFPLAADGTGHSKERHEPTSARVHGDVLHEEGPGCSDGDLQETHHPERRKVTPAGSPSNRLRRGGAVGSSNTPETSKMSGGDEKTCRLVLCLSATLRRRPLWRKLTSGRATSRPRLHLRPPTFNLQGNPDSSPAGGDLHRPRPLPHVISIT